MSERKRAIEVLKSAAAYYRAKTNKVRSNMDGFAWVDPLINLKPTIIRGLDRQVPKTTIVSEYVHLQAIFANKEVLNKIVSILFYEVFAVFDGVARSSGNELGIDNLATWLNDRQVYFYATPENGQQLAEQVIEIFASLTNIRPHLVKLVFSDEAWSVETEATLPGKSDFVFLVKNVANELSTLHDLTELCHEQITAVISIFNRNYAKRKDIYPPPVNGSRYKTIPILSFLQASWPIYTNNSLEFTLHRTTTNQLPIVVNIGETAVINQLLLGE
ncbi:MAG: hypothetical protein WCK11_03190 [Candidatus Falkowbacteria bacterium]